MRVVVRADPVAGDIIALELSEQDIPCILEPILSPGLTVLGFVRVLVPEEDLKGAMAVLEYIHRRFPSMILDFVGLSEVPPFAPGF